MSRDGAAFASAFVALSGPGSSSLSGRHWAARAASNRPRCIPPGSVPRRIAGEVFHPHEIAGGFAAVSGRAAPDDQQRFRNVAEQSTTSALFYRALVQPEIEVIKVIPATAEMVSQLQLYLQNGSLAAR